MRSLPNSQRFFGSSNIVLRTAATSAITEQSVACSDFTQPRIASRLLMIHDLLLRAPFKCSKQLFGWPT
jgi:hypothetical protein